MRVYSTQENAGYIVFSYLGRRPGLLPKLNKVLVSSDMGTEADSLKRHQDCRTEYGWVFFDIAGD
jgi:hypothetical protein